MVSLTPAPSVPGPKEGSEAGCNQEVCRPPPSSAQPSPALPCRCGACYRQIGFIHGHAGRGAAGPALPEHAHTRVGDLHATITTHDARARTGSAGGGVMAQPGSWFWFKRKKKCSWGRCGSALEGFGGGCSEALQRASIGGWRGAVAFLFFKNTQNMLQPRRHQTGWGAEGATYLLRGSQPWPQPQPCPRPRVGRGREGQTGRLKHGLRGGASERRKISCFEGKG